MDAPGMNDPATSFNSRRASSPTHRPPTDALAHPTPDCIAHPRVSHFIGYIRVSQSEGVGFAPRVS